jgi:hypothetical protein
MGLVSGAPPSGFLAGVGFLSLALKGRLSIVLSKLDFCQHCFIGQDDVRVEGLAGSYL